MGYFVQKRGRPTGIPWPARGGEKKMGPAWRPWPGLAEAGLSGEKNGFPKSGNPFFFPRCEFHFLPRGKKIYSYLQGGRPRRGLLYVYSSGIYIE